LLHLVAHAFFKAGLFVAVGVAAGQGISRLHLGGTGLARAGSGGRWLAVAFALDAAALAGLPLTSGFLGKEGILAGAFGWASTSGGALAWGVPLLALAASGLTAFYTLRMWLGAFAGGAGQQAQPFRLPVGYALPLALFAVGALGVCFGPNPFDPDASWVVSALPPVVNASVPVAATEPSLYEARAAATAARGQLGGVAMLATLGATALGLGFAWFRWRGKRPQTARPTHRVASALHRLLENGWGLGAAYDALGRCIIAVGQALAWVDGRALDRIWLSLAHWVGGHSGPSRYAPHISPDPPPFGPPLSLAAVAAATDQHVIDKAYTALAQAAQALGSAARNPRRGQAQAYLMRALVALLALAAGWALWQWVL
jgi:NADH-quinone oxidoreductase subunit L